MHRRGGGPLLTGTSAQSVSEMSSRIYFGICPTIPVARNAGQKLKRVQHDKSMYRNRKRPPSLRGVNVVNDAAIQSNTLRTQMDCHAPKGARNDRGVLARGVAFTMAEILLSLTIIGVVAAITLPSLTGNINERTWNTQRKAVYWNIILFLTGLSGTELIPAIMLIHSWIQRLLHLKPLTGNLLQSFITRIVRGIFLNPVQRINHGIFHSRKCVQTLCMILMARRGQTLLVKISVL